MSSKKQPNLNTCLFVTDIVTSLHGSLCGTLAPQMAPVIMSRVRQQIVNFVAEVEREVDIVVAENTVR